MKPSKQVKPHIYSTYYPSYGCCLYRVTHMPKPWRPQDHWRWERAHTIVNTLNERLVHEASRH